MKTRFVLSALLLAAAVSAVGRVPAGAHDGAPEAAVDPATRSQVIETLLKKLNDSYVFPEVARKMEADIRARVARKEYDSVAGAEAFARKLTEDLQSVSRDLHLMVHYSPRPLPDRAANGELSAAGKEARRRESARGNHGFERVERLPGNVGYVDLRRFADPELGGETLAAAMTFVAETDALIIDLRGNAGGAPSMVALVCSYFFGSRPVHLNDLYWREGGRTEQFWTRPSVPGRRYEGREVFLLTGRRTYSAAEEFAYNLKNLKRATVVGETTGGAAHHGEARKLNDHFVVYLPLARAVNPVTKTNWEGTGVRPDVEVAGERALKTAYVLALGKALERQTDADVRETYRRLIEQQRKELEATRK